MKCNTDIEYLYKFEQERTWRDNIEALHEKNKHKYQVGMPSHFIDIMPRAVPGGWK